MFKKLIKIVLWIIASLVTLIILFGLVLLFGITPPIPDTGIKTLSNPIIPKVHTSKDGLNYIGSNKFRKNRYGIYELYIEGNALERGINGGALTRELLQSQEDVFIDKISEVIPSVRYRRMLTTLITWFNRNLYKHIQSEFLQEIYGLSLSFSEEYNSVGPAYHRIQNYHAAHDIGHAMQSYNLIGCSSFAAWDNYSKDSMLLVGRNFDFYFGNEFSKNKIIEFVAPTEGYNFAFVTWGGMIGAVSGMNEAGLTVTINAGTPEIAYHTGTPVTLLSREMLQYASNIDEAINIAKKRKTFVSESFLVASAEDNTTIIIEKTPKQIDIVYPDSALIICTNHYQGNTLGKTKINQEIQKKATGYRYKVIQQLISQNLPVDIKKTSNILRNTQGIDGENLGVGNEMALNQLIAHHSVMFSPKEKIMWVSTSPNIIGPYLAYDLAEIFKTLPKKENNLPIDSVILEIPADSFLYSKAYKDYVTYKDIKEQYFLYGFEKSTVSDSVLDVLIDYNKEFYEPYLLKGTHLMKSENWDGAIQEFNRAAEKAITEDISNQIKENIAFCIKQKEKNEL